MTRTVLIVDDDPDVRTSISDALEEEGYRVHRAANGREALRLLREGAALPDVILLDMMMPDMDGWAFRSEQQKEPRLSRIPVLIFSAYSLPIDAATQLDAAGFLKKPIRMAELYRALRSVLSEKATS